MACWYLYIVKTVDNFMYAGISTDVLRRFREHCAQGRKTAKYLLAHKPVRVVFSQALGDRSLALKVEYQFKLLSKKDKDRIIDAQQLIFDRSSGRIKIPKWGKEEVLR
jgi:putative endonuclease